MSSLYPGEIDDLTSFIPADVQAGKKNKSLHMRKALEAAQAVEITLGVNPQGGSATVSARIAALEPSNSTFYELTDDTVGPVTIASVNVPVDSAVFFEFRILGLSTSESPRRSNTGTYAVAAINVGAGAVIKDSGSYGPGSQDVGSGLLFTPNGDNIDIGVRGQGGITIDWLGKLTIMANP